MNIRKYNHYEECNFFECYSMGEEFVDMKLDGNNVIKIWACEKHSKLLGDDEDKKEN